MQQLATQGGKLGNLLQGFQLLALAGGDLISRTDQQNVTDLALIQAFGLEHQIQRLVPRHVLQAQGDAALNGVAGDQIEVGEISDQLQHRTYVDVLEVQRQFLAGVDQFLRIAALLIFVGQGTHADGQLVIGLVRGVIKRTGRLDGDAGLVTCGAGIDELHRGREILHVQAHAQRFRQLRFGEVNADLAPLLLNVGRNAGVAQFDDDVAFTQLSTLEVDVFYRPRARRI